MYKRVLPQHCTDQCTCDSLHFIYVFTISVKVFFMDCGFIRILQLKSSYGITFFCVDSLFYSYSVKFRRIKIING